MLRMDGNETVPDSASAAKSTLRRRKGRGGGGGPGPGPSSGAVSGWKKSVGTYADHHPPSSVDFGEDPPSAADVGGPSAEARRARRPRRASFGREAGEGEGEGEGGLGRGGGGPRAPPGGRPAPSVGEKKRPGSATRARPGREDNDDGNDAGGDDERVTEPSSPSSSSSLSATAADASGGGDGRALPFLPGYPAMHTNYTAELSRIDRHFKVVAIGAAVTWAVLAGLCYALTPSSRIVRVEGLEQSAALFAFALLLLTCLGRLMPLFYADLRSIRSGLLVCSLVVQGVALTTDAIMAFCPTPVLIDPVLGTRVHLLRWCEWTPLAFAMTFMTEGIDVPRGGGSSGGGSGSASLRMHYASGFAQGLSTFMGILFPLAPNAAAWAGLMFLSCLLFLFIYPRVKSKRAAFVKAVRGTSVDEIELYDRVRLSYQLLSTCSAVWSLLVVMFFVAGLGPTFAPEGSFLRHPALTMVMEATMDVVTKSLFMGIILDVHDLVFNDAARAERRLEELRQMMSVVWESSSDVIVISVKGISGACTTMLSPTYLRMYQGKRGKERGKRSKGGRGGAAAAAAPARSTEPAKAVVFDLEASEFEPELDADEADGDGDGGGEISSDGGDGPSLGRRRGGGARSSGSSLYVGNALPSPGGGGGAHHHPHPRTAAAQRKRVIRPKMVHKVQFTGLSAFRSAVGGSKGESDGGASGGGGPAGRPKGGAPPRSSHIAKRYSMASNDELSSMADLVVSAWRCRGDHTLLMHDLARAGGGNGNSGGEGDGNDGSDDGTPGTVRCEATVNRLDENALVIVVRDISERFKRFEAEKRVISETTARMKDAEANRFTRHEVKNGLLAAIGLCDSLKETLQGLELTTTTTSSSASSSPSSSPSLNVVANENGPAVAAVAAAMAATPQAAEGGPADGVVLNQLAASDASRCIVELDKTLNEILDTVLSEAMARDVIHGAYEAKMGRVNILSLLSGSAHSEGCSGQKSRFPIITDPVPLPLLMFDPQLLKYIHRNAVSNACKYGKKGGVVTTMIRFDEDRGELEMDVINMPGEHHGEILKLGDRARDAVFSPGKRLHRSFHGGEFVDNVLVSHSSGDGAWIMQKCALTLGGECDIQFDRRRTVFSFRCPATAYDKAMRTTPHLDDPNDFQVPVGSWGIAIDDSKIQRTLLRRFLRIAGVEEDRCIVLGRGRSEIEGFDDMVVQLIDQHPNEYFLLIVDENLDIMEDQTCHKTVSGSLLVENVRHRLLPDQERRMLALVRSANNSSHDVAVYNSRAHGFLPKTPVHRELVLELLAPLWQKRHLYKPSHDQHSPDDGAAGSEEDGRSGTSGGGGGGGGGDRNRRASMSDEDAEAFREIETTLDSVDGLIDCDDAAMRERWGVIWEKLHGLKGDVTTIFESPLVIRVVNEINALRGSKLPQDFASRWASVRALVESIMTEAEREAES